MTSSSDVRRKLVEYAAKDAGVGGYLQLYDVITSCGQDPTQCAATEGRSQLAAYLSERTGIPIAEIDTCIADPQGCAQRQALTLAAEQIGVSPEVLYLAINCAKSGDNDQCAKAGVILGATAMCTAYSGGTATPLCAKIAPIIVNFVWPHINAVVKALTFGRDIDDIVNIITFGQGVSWILAPIGGIASFITGGKGKFSGSQKASIFNQAIKATNSILNSSMVGIWSAFLQTRQAFNLPPPTASADAIERTRADSVSWHTTLSNLISARDRAVKAKSLAKWADAEAELKFFNDIMAPPWPVPNPSQTPITPEIAARHIFELQFMQALGQQGFSDPAWRKSKQGKKVELTGNGWAAWTYSGVCTSCTEDDVKLFASMITRLYVENRIIKIEPVVMQFVQMFSDQVAADLSDLERLLAGFSKIGATASTQNLVLSPAINTSQIIIPTSIIKKPTITIDRSLLTPTPTIMIDRSLLSKFTSSGSGSPSPAAKPTSQVPKADTLQRGVAWCKANPQYAIPASAAIVALAVLAARRIP